MFSFRTLVSVSLLAIAVGVKAESHTISFTNNCGYGTVSLPLREIVTILIWQARFQPTLILQGGTVASTGGAYTSGGPIYGAIAYLQTGSCGFNGEGCTLGMYISHGAPECIPDVSV